MVAATTGRARALVTQTIAAADGDTRAAVMQLAALLDDHMRDCPHITPMRPRQAVTR